MFLIQPYDPKILSKQPLILGNADSHTDYKLAKLQPKTNLSKHWNYFWKVLIVWAQQLTVRPAD